jgi:AcrR family transcriptional regulator
VFAQEGYAGASMRTIAVAVGIRKSSLFHHFSSKQALYQEVFTWLMVDLAQLIPLAVSSDETFAERLDRLSRTFVRHLAAKPSVACLLLRELVNGGRCLDERARDAMHTTLLATSLFLEEGMEQEMIARQDARQLALSLAGLHLTYFATPEVSGRLLGGDVFEQELVDVREAVVVGQVRRICGATWASA